MLGQWVRVGGGGGGGEGQMTKLVDEAVTERVRGQQAEWVGGLVKGD